MLSFGSAPRFEVLADGTYYARAGTQNNCAGIAGIHVRIAANNSQQLTFLLAEHDGDHQDGYGRRVPGYAVPLELREALFNGVKEIFDEQIKDIGIEFELIDAIVHEVDGNVRQFKTAGKTAMTQWLALYY